MLNNEYRKALTEVYAIINNSNNEINKKIPKQFIEFVEENMDRNYKFKVIEGVDIINQPIREETKKILALVYRDYLK